jgi:pimeloyl-ACP methyl ester carboxylesterase
MIEGSTFVPIPDAGHTTTIENAGAVNAAIKSFYQAFA